MTEKKYLVENFAKIFTLNSKHILLVACTIVILACDDLITKTANRLSHYRQITYEKMQKSNLTSQSYCN